MSSIPILTQKVKFYTDFIYLFFIIPNFKNLYKYNFPHENGLPKDTHNISWPKKQNKIEPVSFLLKIPSYNSTELIVIQYGFTAKKIKIKLKKSTTNCWKKAHLFLCHWESHSSILIHFSWLHNGIYIHDQLHWWL